MAIDNLNYYSAWLPAGQQTDRYSSQPWCLRSKNLDIFSSSKSVKATAWSTPTTTDADVIKQDWKLVLKTDWKVYERENGVDTLFVDPSINFPVHEVSYNWKFWDYVNWSWWTVQDLVAKYEWDVLKSFVVFTDRASYTYSSVKYHPDKKFSSYSSNLTLNDSQFTTWYEFTKNTTSGSSSYIDIKIDNANFATVPIRVYADQYDDSHTDITLVGAKWRKYSYYYDPQLDSMIPYLSEMVDLTLPATDIKTEQITLNVPTNPWREEIALEDINLTFNYTRKSWYSDYWWNGQLYVDMNKAGNGTIMHNSDWDYNEFYSYLPVRDRKLTPVWENYWIKWSNFQPLYTWTYQWVAKDNSTRELVTRYDLVMEYWWENNVSMDIIWIAFWSDQAYMIGNMDWNWYIIPCDLSWWRWTPYIAYGCTFTGVANIDYLMYLVWDDRGISQLRAYNWQELVKVIWWNKESNTNDLIDIEEQYKFDWKIVKYRWNLILSTSDNRIFEYGQTYGGKGWVFIHEIPWTITNLKADWNDLTVEYSVTSGWTTTKYLTTYQDDIPIKNYNTEWMAEYPIILWNHLLEKEESDLYASYILPNSACKLEFWASANHYHFWTFKVPHNTATPTVWSKWYPSTLDPALVFIERNDDYLTFRLDWELPLNSSFTGYICAPWKWSTTYIYYSEVNHFRKIWEITASWFEEWEFRFTNLNNKLELPKSHSLQIMVKGKGTANYTPELFSLDLVANQRERW